MPAVVRRSGGAPPPWRVVVAIGMVVLGVAPVVGAPRFAAAGPTGFRPVVGTAGEVPRCDPDRPVLRLTGRATPDRARTYRALRFEVAPGTTRVEVAYRWTSRGPESRTDTTVIDLGLWDEHGDEGPGGFRGWSGDRQGRLDRDQGPVFVQADRAERGYVAGPVRPGRWTVELGFGAVHSAGADWTVLVRCRALAVGAAHPPDPVDPAHVARDAPGWYRADLHLHAYHSNPAGPAPAAMADAARRAGLDVVPVTEYVTDAHWAQLGAAARANPDLVLWPGREVITYRGHLIVLGETPSTLEYRQGRRGVEMADVIGRSRADGALVGVAHPTAFPGEALRSFCRGCEFELGDRIDWDLVDLVEVVTGPAVVDPATGKAPEPGVAGVANPFVATAVDRWEELLAQGHRLTAVAGSDDKLGPGYGSAVTVIGARRLARSDLAAALLAGRAYVQARGTASPTLQVEARAGEARAGMGATLVATEAELVVGVRGGSGQRIEVSRDGEVVREIPVTGDEFETRLPIDRDPAEGPLGTFWRVDVVDTIGPTALSNPVFLADRMPSAAARPATPTVAPRVANLVRAPDTGGSMTTDRPSWWVLPVGVLAAAGGAVLLVGARRRAAR